MIKKDSRIKTLYAIVLFLFLIQVVHANIPYSSNQLENNVDYWVQKGSNLFDAGRYNEALTAYEKALSIDPNYAYAWQSKGISLEKLGRYNEALTAYEKALSIDPNFAFAWYNKGNVLISLGRYQDALEAYDDALAIGSHTYTWNFQQGWYGKGNALSALGRYEEAIIAYNKTLSIDPNYSDALYGKGNALFALGKYPEAIEAFDKALAIDPNYKYAWIGKGNVLTSIGKYPEALDAYNTALSIDPNFTEAKNNRDKILDYLNGPLEYFFYSAAIIIAIVLLYGLHHLYQKRKKISGGRDQLKPKFIYTSDRNASSSHHDVFISYANMDKPTADAACAKLESHNIRCWIAPRDVPPGMNFPQAIIEGIEGSKVMVVIFSSHSNNSRHVIRELTTAVNKGLIIVPFRIENVVPSKSMEYLIGLPHWLDALTPPLEQHLDALAITIEKFISANSPETSEKK